MNKKPRLIGTLTPESLIDEYNTWRVRWGDGRSLTNIRFGQYLVNNYLRDGSTFPELFYAESAQAAYETALAELMYG